MFRKKIGPRTLDLGSLEAGWCNRKHRRHTGITASGNRVVGFYLHWGDRIYFLAYW